MLNTQTPLNDVRSRSQDFDLMAWVDFLAERYGWTMEEILNLPIPTFIALQEAIQDRQEKEERQMKKGKY